MVDFPRTLASDRLPAHTGRSTVLRYGIAIGSVGLALLARAAIAPLLGDKLPFIWFLVAVAAAAWFGGSGPSRLSMALGFVAAEVFFIRHDRAWWIGSAYAALVKHMLEELVAFSALSRDGREGVWRAITELAGLDSDATL